jgi:2-oxoglutarate dehydrogenase E2 component (dihydrolipoamide succinyltransferase)
MSIELKVPTIGESITEVEIGAWLKREGESVRKDEPVATLESEKATVDLPAPDAGTLTQVLRQKGEVAKVGEVIAYLEPSAGTQATQEPGKALPKTAPQPSTPGREPRVMPAAQRALAERGLRPEQVQPTGPGGRLLKEDVLEQVQPPQPEFATTILTRAQIPPAETPEVIPASVAREEEVVPMSRLRRTVAERLVEAQHQAALLRPSTKSIWPA